MSRNRPRNLTQIEESLTGQEIKALNATSPGLGDKMHRLISMLGQAHSAQAGFKGPVGFAKQQGRDELQRELPGFMLSGQRAADADDAIDDTDLTTLRQVRRLISQAKDEVSVEEAEPTEEVAEDPVSGALPYIFFGLSNPWSSLGGTSGLTTGFAFLDRTLALWGFCIDFPMEVASLTWELTLNASAIEYSWGVYDANGVLLINTGLHAETVTGFKTHTVDPPVTLLEGFYFLGYNKDGTAKGSDTSGPTFRIISNGGAIHDILNHADPVNIRIGTLPGGTPGGSAAQVASFDPADVVTTGATGVNNGFPVMLAESG